MRENERIMWWIYLLGAIFFYALFQYLPAMILADQKAAVFAEYLSPISAIIFLVLAANSLFKNDPPPEETREEQQDEEQKVDEE